MILGRFGHLSASPSFPIFCLDGLDLRPSGEGLVVIANGTAPSTNKYDSEAKGRWS